MGQLSKTLSLSDLHNAQNTHICSRLIPLSPTLRAGCWFACNICLHKSEPDCHILYSVHAEPVLQRAIDCVTWFMSLFDSFHPSPPPPPPSWERAPLGGSRGGKGWQIHREGGNTQILYSTRQIYIFFGGGGIFLKIFFWGIFIFIFSSYYIQHCFICRPSDSTVPTDAGIEPRTVATGADATSLDLIRSHPQILMKIRLIKPTILLNKCLLFLVCSWS
jgi:hypothetical protein